MNRLTKLLLLILIIGYATPAIFADPGDLDERGGHYNQKTGEYHLHKAIAPSQPEVKNSDNRASAIFHATSDAERDAERESMTWYSAGFIFGILGVGAAYVVPPSVPSQRLLGKSPEYIIFYTESYKEAITAKRVQQSTTGCVISGLAAILYLLYSTGEL